MTFILFARDVAWLMRLLSMGGHSYAYDGDGSRVAQTVGALTLRYTLDVQPGLTTVLAETTGAITTRYLHGPTGIHAQQNADGGWRWLLQDGLQSVRAVANSTDIIAAQQYSPYGVPFTPLPETDFGFTGEMTDDNDLVYLRARYLDPGMGVFASLDPQEGNGKVSGLNRYSWVVSNPINLVDPSGHQALPVCTFGYCQLPNGNVVELPEGWTSEDVLEFYIHLNSQRTPVSREKEQVYDPNLIQSLKTLHTLEALRHPHLPDATDYLDTAIPLGAVTAGGLVTWLAATTLPVWAFITYAAGTGAAATISVSS